MTCYTHTHTHTRTRITRLIFGQSPIKIQLKFILEVTATQGKGTVESDKTKFKTSSFSALGPWVNFLASLNFNFLTYKVRIIISTIFKTQTKVHIQGN